jgi:hypothetical protein
MGIVRNNDRQFKLGMHSYTLHLNGCGESWGFEQDYAFEKTIDLPNDVSVQHLAEVNAAAQAHGLDLELNVSIDAPCDPRVNASVEESLHIDHAIGAQLVKFRISTEADPWSRSGEALTYQHPARDCIAWPHSFTVGCADLTDEICF